MKNQRFKASTLDCGLRSLALAAIASFLTMGVAKAATFTVDFEDFNVASGSTFTVVNSDKLNTVGGPSITLSPFGATEQFFVFDLAEFASGQGVDTQALLVSSVSGSSAVTFQFSDTVSSVSMSIGDFGSDTDTVKVEFLDASANVLGEHNEIFPREISPLFKEFSFSSSISAFRISSDSGNTFFVDDVSFDASPIVAPVPLPAGLPLLLIGLGSVFLLRRK